MLNSECEYCDKGMPLKIGRTDDYGIAIKYPDYLTAYGYDVHGMGSNEILVKIKFCPMCGKNLSRKELI